MEQPPESTANELSEYLVREIRRITMTIENTNKLTPINNLPAKPQDGHFYYFARTITPNITSIGFWGYEAGTWVKL